MKKINQWRYKTIPGVDAAFKVHFYCMTIPGTTCAGKNSACAGIEKVGLPFANAVIFLFCRIRILPG